MVASGLREPIPNSGCGCEDLTPGKRRRHPAWGMPPSIIDRMGPFRFRLQPVLQRVLDWLPATLSVLMIALESTATFSANNTSQWLYPLWVRLFGPISPAHWAEVHHLIRKTGHFVGYGLVSVAFFYSWRQTLHRMAVVKHWTLWRRASVLAVLCTLLIASLDEYHQSFLPSRTSSPRDVLIDLCGAIAFQLVLLLIIQLFRPRFRAA
jgi:VanZ family protein